MQYRRRLVSVRVAATVFAVSLTVGALAEPPAESNPAPASPPAWAVWAPKELRFTYLGFTSHYSCDGLADKMRSIVLQLGARSSDLKVREIPCSGSLGRPTEFPGVTVNMNVLTPWDATSANATVTPVPAHWKRVELSTDRDPLREAGDCELIEQAKTRVLPLFAARNVDYHSTCIPNQLQIGGTVLKADVLIADEPQTPGTKPSAPPPPPPAPR